MSAHAPEAVPSDGAGWVARIMSVEATDADHAACATWRLLTPFNEADYQAARRAWHISGHRAELVEDTPQRAPLAKLSSSGAMAFAAMAVAAALFFVYPYKLEFGAKHKTYSASSGRPLEAKLKNGATVALNRRAEIFVTDRSDETSVQLVRGEAHFNVKPGTSRRFVVYSGMTVVTVTGTAFEVSHFERDTIVSVSRGSVQVSSGQTLATALKAGERAQIGNDGIIRPMSPLPPNIVSAWRAGQIIFFDEPLDLVVNRLRNYTSSKIILQKDVDRIRNITATFANDDVNTVLNGLKNNLPIAVERNAAGDILISAAREPKDRGQVAPPRRNSSGPG